MTKHFFVVVPFNPAHAVAKKGGLHSKILHVKNVSKSDEKTFEEDRSQLEQRISMVQEALGRTGVRSVQLSTEQAVELFYKQFNPGEGTQKAEL